MEVKDYLNVPSDVFVVTEEVYQEKKEELKKFLEAYKISAEWMIENPEEAAELAVQYAIDGKDEKQNLQIIKLRNASSVSPDTDQNGLGTLDHIVLQRAAETYQQLGLINSQLEMDEVVSDDLIPKK
jgi:NitT/TauT family transport system substrate-binding protein